MNHQTSYNQFLSTIPIRCALLFHNKNFILKNHMFSTYDDNFSIKEFPFFFDETILLLSIVKVDAHISRLLKAT